MNRFLITIDAGCDLSKEKCEAAGLNLVPMNVMMDDEIFADTADTQHTLAFYARMREGAIPKTSQLTSHDLLAAWAPLTEQNLPIVHISLGSAISGTAHNAKMAAEEWMEKHPDQKIYVIDSTSASTGYGLMAMEAVRLRDEGKSAEECVEYLETIKHNVHAYFTTSDLHWLQLGGRVSKTAAVLGTMLKINPVLNLSPTGALEVIDKVRGSKNAMRRIMTAIEETVIDPEKQTLYISHADNPKMLETYVEEIQKRFAFKDINVNYIGTVIGAHTGPGLITLFWMGKPRETANQ